MARRPSATSFLSSQSIGESSQTRSRPSISASRSARAPSISTEADTRRYFDDRELDPDELFTKHSISEIKAIQLQLRADAEAKQEELRVMVGARYRDLLQASTSIISISKSAKRVQEALEEAREAILSQEQPSQPRRTSLSSREDSHLRMLQSLSAHIKLLLDAPEHLWRLIEGEKYFQAAWLFLLARVIHRALIREDEQDEDSWIHHGLNVLDEFPLIQRQWDTVSHFRTQIVYKATLSLNAHNRSSEDTCATLLTLHLLDSRPLTETLTLFLSQRSKSLAHLFTKSPVTADGSVLNGAINGHANGHTSSALPLSSKISKSHIGRLKTTIQDALDAISRTVNHFRNIFQDSASGQSSMIVRVLAFIQSDSSASSLDMTTIHSELLMETNTLLTTLPSSTHFLLLPDNIRSYKPYVDLTSSGSSLPQSFLSEKLSAWFAQAIEEFRSVLGKWFYEINTVKEVWSIRSSSRKWLAKSDFLENSEQCVVRSVLDDVSQQRIVAIWKSSLAEAAQKFELQLSSVTSEDADFSDCDPLQHIYQTPPPPAYPPAGVPTSLHSTLDASFHNYKSLLAQHLSGRTPYLDSILGSLEKCAATLQKDFSRTMSSSEGDTQKLERRLRDAYAPESKIFCTDIIHSLQHATDILMERPRSEKIMKRLAFISRIARGLASSSPFLANIQYDHDLAQEFGQEITATEVRIISCWREFVVAQTVSSYIAAIRTFKSPLFASSSSLGPSPYLMDSLLSLSNSLHNLGVSHDSLLTSRLACELLESFATAFIKTVDEGLMMSPHQALHDWHFLRRMMLEAFGGKAKLSTFDSSIKQALGKFSLPWDEEIDKVASEYLLRSQVMLATLLPVSVSTDSLKDVSKEKLAMLLTRGIPNPDAQSQPVIELAKPSARFGLLMVESND